MEAASADGAAPERRGGFSYKTVYVAFFSLLACAGVVALVMYWKLLYYERAVALHVPEDTTFAARVDVEQAVLFEPVRKHLFPLVDGLAVGDPRLKSRTQRLQQHTRIDFAVDLREVVVARGPRPNDWLVGFGGLFPKEHVVAGLQQVFVEEGYEPVLGAGGRMFTIDNGLAVGQSEDGCLWLASSEARLLAALPRRGTSGRLLLARDGAGGFALAGDFPETLADAPVVAKVREVRGIKTAQVELKLGNPLQITSQIEFLDVSDPAKTEVELDLLTAALRAFVSGQPGADLAGERRIVAEAKPSVVGPGNVVLVAPWDRADVDRGAESLARALRTWVDGPRFERNSPGVTAPR